jgi:hypothetical protein
MPIIIEVLERWSGRIQLARVFFHCLTAIHASLVSCANVFLILLGNAVCVGHMDFAIAAWFTATTSLIKPKAYLDTSNYIGGLTVGSSCGSEFPTTNGVDCLLVEAASKPTKN